jgi:hypothetical protein
MVRVGETLVERCEKAGLRIKIKYLDLWTSDVLMPNTDLVVEMFPYYKDLKIPVINGRPFLSHLQEEQLFSHLVGMIKTICEGCQS